jgi:ATP-binding cassette, subfamily B, bacterial
MRNVKSMSYFKTLLRTIKLIFNAAPFEISVSIAIFFISGFSPTLTLLLTKYIVDDLTKIIESGSILLNTDGANKIYWLLSIMLTVNVLTSALNPFGNILLPNIEDRTQGNVKYSLMKKVSEFKDILIFESPEILNLLKLAERGTRNLNEFAYILLTTLIGLLEFFPAVFVSISIGWWIPIIILLTSIPSLIIEPKYRVLSWSIEETQADAIRQLDIHYNILLSETFAKEVRVLSIQKLILEKWADLYQTTYQKMYRLRLKGGFLTFASSCFEGLGLAIPYFVIVSGVINRTYTIGDLVLFSGLILQVRSGLNRTIGSFNQLLSNLLSIRPIFKFLDLKSTLNDSHNFYGADYCAENNTGLKIESINFSYPGATHLALKEINLKVKSGQLVVIVGENGSGKSTLAKLICRFYDPQSGEIVWNGKSIKSLPIDDWRAKMAVVFQDFARFPASVRENVGWANLAKMNDDIFIKSLLLKVKLLKFFDQQHEGMDTLLTKLFDGGTDLSGGQWQRIAIARALSRMDSTELLILDEPTASVDPENEHDIYALIREMAKNCTTIVISHRLGMARFSDRVVVLNDGMIIEEGTHEALMLQSGKYSEMFKKQMSQYV